MIPNNEIESLITELVHCDLYGGMLTIEEIQRQSLEYAIENGASVADANDIVRRVLARESAQKSAEMVTWPAVTDCDRLDAAFEELNSLGILARHNWTCCSNCGKSEMPDEFERLDGEIDGKPIVGYVFYHEQDTEYAMDRGLFLCYGSTEGAPSPEAYEAQCLNICRVACDVLAKHGLQVIWNGRYDTKPNVQLDWKRRSPPRMHLGGLSGCAQECVD